jgi:enoyl-[acyl-carrier protein] reductase I
MSMFAGKKIVVLGVANDKSIAWGISELLRKEGADLAFNYVNEAIERRVRPLAESIGCETVLPCDVQNDEQIDSFFDEIGKRWGKIDGLVHSVAFAEKEDLTNRFSQTTRKGFHTALDVSAFSMIRSAASAARYMPDGGAMLTLTYLGSERVVTNYNVMGVAKAALECSVRYLAADLGTQNIRVNAISAGPIKTLAASGIPQFRELLGAFAAKAPMRRNVTQEDVAGTAAYLMGHLSAGVTGEIIHVDCGFNVMGF